ncbi:MAG: hypothetical protein IPN95_12430 [Bacteroidetes bacterium]|jgi:hypothetical protein|nr:hypothetical protein [Bacteroidota bacterium]
MAIEIRELVVKATVNKSSSGSNSDFVTKNDLVKFQDKLVSKILGKVKDLIQEERSFR